MSAAPSFHIVSGSDEFLAASEARKLADSLCPPADQAFGLETFDGSVETEDEVAAVLGRVLEGILTLGFFGSRKLVWLKDAFFLGDIQICARESVKKRLAELADMAKTGFPEGHVLLISTSGIDRRTAFYKSCQPLARHHVYDLPDKPREADEALHEFLGARLKDVGLRAEGDAAYALLERCGADRRQLANEVEKLKTYLGDRASFTDDDVREIISPAREVPGWDLQDHFGTRRLPLALDTLRRLFARKESPIALVIGLEGRVRDLLVIRESLQRRWANLSGSGNWKKLVWSTPPEADAVFSAFDRDPRAMNEWRGGKLAEQAGLFSVDELKRCHAWITEAHERMVSGSVPGELLLELFLLRALGRGRA